MRFRLARSPTPHKRAAISPRLLFLVIGTLVTRGQARCGHSLTHQMRLMGTKARQFSLLDGANGSRRQLARGRICSLIRDGNVVMNTRPLLSMIGRERPLGERAVPPVKALLLAFVRSFGVRQLAAAFRPAILLADFRMRIQCPPRRLNLEENRPPARWLVIKRQQASALQSFARPYGLWEEGGF